MQNIPPQLRWLHHLALASVPLSLLLFATIAMQAVAAPALPDLIAPGSSLLLNEMGAAQPDITTYDEGDPALVISGTWTVEEDSRAMGEAYLVSSTPGDTLVLTFTGPSLIIYRTLTPTGGEADVYIDDEYVTDLRFAAGEKRWQVPYVLDDLGPGAHELRLTVDEGWEDNTLIMVDAINMGSPSLTDPHQQAALARVNHYRTLAGLPSARTVQSVHLGAQAHAEYLALNQDDPSTDGLGSHREDADLPGYTGWSASERTAFFGYEGGMNEIITFIGDPEWSVDGWMDTVYHRNPIMCYGCRDVGYGVVNDARGRFDVMNLGSDDPQRPPQRLIYTYPVAGQKDVPTSWDGREIPDPLPEISTEVGFPISLYVAPAESELDSTALVVVTPTAELGAEVTGGLPRTLHSPHWALATAELRVQGGAVMPIYLLDQETDPQNRLSANQVFLIPHTPLQPNTTYQAHIAGTDSNGEPFDHSWSFTTAPPAMIQEVWGQSGACSATMTWQTAGAVVQTFIRIGKVAGQYEQEIAGQLFTNGGGYGARVGNLLPNHAYHYQIVAEDSTGHWSITADRVLHTYTPTLLRVPEEYASISAALNVATACDTVRVAPGTYAGPFQVPAGVHLSGAGADVTTLHQGQYVVALTGNSSLSGFTIRHSGTATWDAGVLVHAGGAGSALVRDNRILDNSIGILSNCGFESCGQQVAIQNNLIANNRHSGVYDLLGKMTLVNNTLVANEIGVYAAGNNSTIRNNIIAHSQQGGIWADAEIEALSIGYNNVWENDDDYREVEPGSGSLEVDPRFANRTGGDYSLAAGSPAIDAGDPAAIYLDANGSRNDMGITGGPGNAPNLGQLAVTTTPTYPRQGEPVHYQVQLVNRGVVAHQVQVTVTLPAGITYIQDSARASQGIFVVNANSLVFAVGEALLGVPILLDLALELEASTSQVAADPAARQPQTVRLPVTATWDQGEMKTEIFTIIDGSLHHLPLLPMHTGQ